MRLLKLTVADLPTDDRATPTRTEWINPDHIETAASYLTWADVTPTLWLELTLASGTVRYSLIGPVPLADLDTARTDAITRLGQPCCASAPASTVQLETVTGRGRPPEG